MKRTPVVLVAVAVAGLATAGIVAVVSGDAAGSKPGGTPPAAAIAPEAEPSRQFDRDTLERQAKEQADQTAQAQDALADQVRKRADELGAAASSRPHQLQVTISEQKPYDAYMPGDRPGQCVRASLAPASLVVTDAAATSSTPLADQALPATARLTPGGTCEARMSVEVPRAAMYHLGVAIMGRGIKGPTDPGGTEVQAGVSPQRVVVVG
ncbi:hypothetical protein [Aeromicrobium wangtongii]|uniref:Uncharacterized protein n=1 Tax=Aeromicrobium wangtongii TaxID=2969247 RepID=A0ABY5MDD5_9ACTN|nr:hypothetical protein [Aeromicrobium wangtongii]MCD9197751.1 hypothetical protein [Aeromicrobium wangtongii]UUP15234.1 hypothetical protein NQV15_07970 [Aeromicrobium wangtongii]